MEIQGKKAVIVGGASGMAKATAELLHQKGADVAILDLPTSAGAEVAKELGGTFHEVNVLDDQQVETALADAVAALGGLHIAVNTAGGGTAKRTLTKEGPHPLDEFRRTIELNLIGTFNLNRLQAFHMSSNEPEDGERGVIIDTASIAAFEGQIGQVAYTAAKAGIAGMTLTMARDLGSLGIRVMTIAPSLFSTGLTEGIPDEFADVLTKDAAFPKRMGRPGEYARLAVAIVENPMLNGSTHPPGRRAALRAEVAGRGDRAVGSMDLQLQVDVTEAAGLGEPAHVTLTVTVPDALGTDPIVCFAKPGAGYSRRYYTEDLPGPASGAQAALARRAGLGVRLGRPSRRGRQLPARTPSG